MAVKCSHVSDTEKPEESHNDQCSYSSEFLVRPSWVDAKLALQQINKGRARGARAALWLRAHTQSQLFDTGLLVQNHAGKLTFAAVLCLATLCIGLKHSAATSANVDFHTLWVEEGGRLQQELEYVKSHLGEGAGYLHQVIVQTPLASVSSSSSASNMLRADALLVHLQAIHAASRVTVDMFDVTWRLRDLCLTPTFPIDEAPIVEQIFESLMPCVFITPLDCFWEGSKLLGPDVAVPLPAHDSRGYLATSRAQNWTQLDPVKMLDQMKRMMPSSQFQFDAYRNMLIKAGAAHGYQRRPCLDPTDPGCPSQSRHVDVAAVLTGGCRGLAGRHMHWPQQLLLGGVQKNASGHVISARALQTTLPVMGELDLYEHWRGTWKTHNMQWSVHKARAILDHWLLKFNQELSGYSGSDGRSGSSSRSGYDINSFSMAALQKLMQRLAHVNRDQLSIGYVLMLLYAGWSLYRCDSAVRSQAGLAVAGVALVSLSVAAGLGVASLLGLTFNACTTQIAPLLMLGLGVNDVFVLCHTYADTDLSAVVFSERVGELLRRAGVSVLLTSVCNVIALLCAAILPVPAVRQFSLQCAVMVCLNTFSVLVVFPAMMSMDLRRRRARMYDLACCWGEPGDRACSSVQMSQCGDADDQLNKRPPGGASGSGCAGRWGWLQLDGLLNWYASQWTRQGGMCGRWRPLVAVLSVAGVIVACVCGALLVRDGLELTDIVPRHSRQYRFLQVQRRHFGVFYMYAVTEGHFDYPANQPLLYEFHEAFTRVPYVVKNDNGGLRDFWLGLFRDWLVGLQEEFDREWRRGVITRERWFSNASDDAVLAYKLLVQTGRVDDPVDRRRLPHARLVKDGLIERRAFYNYLSAWVGNDPLAYAFSEARLQPPPRVWLHQRHLSDDLKVPKSLPLSFAQIPLQLSGLHDSERVLDAVRQVRAICTSFRHERGLPNLPSGVPFTFWEQYLHVRLFVCLSLACVLVAVWLVLSVALMNAWAASIVVLVLAASTAQLFAVMGFLRLRLNAITAAMLVLNVGVGVDLSVHLVMAFLTSVGDRGTRVSRALGHMMRPLLHSAVSTGIGVSMLAMSEFNFVVRYFCVALLVMVLLGVLNALLVLPALLAMVGPPAEVRALNSDGRLLCAPSPVPTVSQHRTRGPRVYRSSSSSSTPPPPHSSTTSDRRGSAAPPTPRQQHGSRVSLSTITEESACSSVSGHSSAAPSSSCSSSCSSCSRSACCGRASPSRHHRHTDEHETSRRQDSHTHDIVVEPHVVVETSYPDNEGSSAGRCSTTTDRTLTVTATTRVKVEVHRPPPSCGDSQRRHCARPGRHRQHARRHCTRTDTTRSSTRHHTSSS